MKEEAVHLTVEMKQKEREHRQESEKEREHRQESEKHIAHKESL